MNQHQRTNGSVSPARMAKTVKQNLKFTARESEVRFTPGSTGLCQLHAGNVNWLRSARLNDSCALHKWTLRNTHLRGRMQSATLGCTNPKQAPTGFGSHAC